MDSYVYPFNEFLADFEAVTPPFNAATPTFIAAIARIRDYVRRTYLEPSDYMERGTALSAAFHFLSQHMPKLDSGRIAVRGEHISLVSLSLLRAIHTLVCEPTLNATGDYEPATAEQVINLAEKLENEQTENDYKPHSK